ncbi:hypothetical protein [Roseimaritima ulvae]|uniref:Uncharacterized protein n=1 Tax=Roseimaritima ulvae TaxID=980254 RepID=A0A5B9R6F7_9BACT|nr:hypothetical protein [Roseimaritima ulvae]QEG41863.1 hypothetical protein UC8_38910 [Roseimaritima ulvae]
MMFLEGSRTLLRFSLQTRAYSDLRAIVGHGYRFAATSVLTSLF